MHNTEEVLTESDQQRRSRFHRLDAVRGLAAIGVVAYHTRLSDYFLWYWGAMDFFFVLSGFLITRTLLVLRAQGKGFGTFLIYRMCRLLPAFILMLLAVELFVYLANAGALIEHWAGKIDSGFSWYYLSLIQNIDRLYVAEGFFPRGIALDHFWSLILEEQYYLLWGCFLFFYLGQPRQLSIRFILLLMALLLMPLGFRYFGFHWWLLLARSDGFLAGSFLGLLVFGRYALPRLVLQAFLILRWPILIMALAWLFYFSAHGSAIANHPAGYQFAWLDVSCFVVISVALVYSVYRFDIAKEEAGRAASMLAFIGAISYELYVVHYPVMAFLTNKKVSLYIINMADVDGIILFPSVLSLSMLLAWILHKTLTQPCLARREKIRSSLIAATHKLRVLSFRA